MKRSSSTKSRSGAATTGRASSGSRRSTPRGSTGGSGRSRAVASGRTSAASRKSSRTTRRSIPWPVYLAALLAFAAWSFYPAARVEYAEQREKSRLENQLAQLKERNNTLRAQVDRLKTPEGVEDLARRNLGYVAPGEQAYIVDVPDETTAVAPVAPARSAEATASLARRILDFVFAVR